MYAMQLAALRAEHPGEDIVPTLIEARLRRRRLLGRHQAPRTEPRSMTSPGARLWTGSRLRLSGRQVRGMLVAAGGLVGLTVAGCATSEPALGGTTATVWIDGRDVAGVQPVRCRQSGWDWFIETPDSAGTGFHAALRTGGEVIVETVKFRDADGFSGLSWAGHIGKAEVAADGGHYLITGTADGHFAEDPSETVSVLFRIAADC